MVRLKVQEDNIKLKMNALDGATFRTNEYTPIVSGSSDYNELDNKPSIEGVTLEGNKTLEELGAFSGDYNDLINKPTALSDFDNDEDFISQETDPTVPSWAKASNKPTYTAQEVGALPDNTVIPSKTSDLANDEGFIISPNVVYCTCATGKGTAAKVATIVSGTLTTLNVGDQAIVKFASSNTSASPTLKIGNTDAKQIMRYGTTAPSASAETSWNAGSPILFVYDGTYWVMCGYLNSTYSEISVANITNGSSSTTGLTSGRRAKSAVEEFAPVKDVQINGTSVVNNGVAQIPPSQFGYGLAPVITESASGDIVSITDGADNYPIKSLKVSLEPKQSGTGDPSPSNIRPISGWSGVEVEQFGKNLLNMSACVNAPYNPSVGTELALTPNGRTWTDSGGVYSIALTDWGVASILTPLLKAGNYRIALNNITGRPRLGIYKLDKNKKVLGVYTLYNPATENLTVNDTYTLTEDGYFCVYISGNGANTIEITRPQIELGTTATPYEPYQGESKSIPFKDSEDNPITVYGGEVEIISGVGKSTMAMVDLSTLNWSGSSGIKLSTDISDIVKKPSANNVPANIIAEKYKTSAAAPISANDGKIGVETSGRIQCGSSETPSGMLCFELATPTDLTTTPESISTYKGANTIWSDGAVECEYCCDTKLYIEKKLNE